MMTFYTKEMAELDRKRVYSRPVVICMDYILLRKLEAARNMLKYSEYSYAEISAILAFSSQSHFSRIFKKETGYTPKEYRDRFFQN